MKQVFLPILLFSFVGGLLLGACTENATVRNQQLLLGHWVALDTSLSIYLPSSTLSFYDITADGRPIYANNNGYFFGEQGACEKKVGFYDYYFTDGFNLTYDNDIDHDAAWFCGVPTTPYCHDDYFQRVRESYVDIFLYNVQRSHGHRTGYVITGDSMHIYDPAQKQWIGHRVEFRSPDTLLLATQGDTIQEWFCRKTYDVESEPPIDAIVFHYPRTCVAPGYSFCLQRDGRVVSYNYLEEGRFFLGRMPAGAYEQLEIKFRQSNVSTYLEDRLSTIKRIGFPAGTSCITFVRGNEIVTVPAPFPLYENIGKEFYWAYLAGLFFLDYTVIQPDSCNNYPPKYRDGEVYHADAYPPVYGEFEDFGDMKLFKGKEPLPLRMPSPLDFYLGVLLSQAPKTDQAFEPRYRLTGLRDKKQSIQTDGRYFRYKRHGRELTLDLGFNFIQSSHLDPEMP